MILMGRVMSKVKIINLQGSIKMVKELKESLHGSKIRSHIPMKELLIKKINLMGTAN